MSVLETAWPYLTVITSAASAAMTALLVQLRKQYEERLVDKDEQIEALRQERDQYREWLWTSLQHTDAAIKVATTTQLRQGRK